MTSITFKNELATDVVIYDSYSSESNDNYFGDLTKLTTVAAGASATVEPKHPFASVFIVNHADTDQPIARYQWLKVRPAKGFDVTQADVDAMTQTAAFIAFRLASPDDASVKRLDALLQAASSTMVKDIDALFATLPAYAKVTFVTYMLGITAAALAPPPPPPDPHQPPPPPAPPLYSLSKLARLMGAGWPDGLPDVAISSYKVENVNGAIVFTATVELTHVPAAGPGAVGYLAKCLGVDKVTFTIVFHDQLSLALFATRLILKLDDIKIPLAGSSAITLQKPTVSLDINPLFKFVVFQIAGKFPFTIHGKTFDVAANLTIDNEEVAFGLTLEGQDTSLPPPPMLPGVHFDSIGLNLGFIFEPPSVAFGIQGKFHIGDGPNQIAVDDDTFALVVELDGEVPNPVYGTFYVPKMDLATVITAFTNSKTSLDVPVHFTDLSFLWAEEVMKPLVLPDGTLSQMGLGFSAGIDVAGFGFYGRVGIDMNTGLTADVESSPIALGAIFELKGDGKGVVINVDEHGNPIKNNQIRDAKVLKALLAKSKPSTLVKPGGPVLTLQTNASPFLHLNARASLLGLVDAAVSADIDKSGLAFELDYGSVLTTKLTCKLADWHNLTGSFSFGIDRTIHLPHVGPVSLGSIHLQAGVAVGIAITTSLSDVTFTATGAFDFEGLHLSIPRFSVDVHIAKITDLLEALGTEIENEAKSIFGDVLNQAAKWAEWVGNGIIAGVNDMAPVLRAAFNQTMDQAAALMKGARVAATAVASGLRDAYNASQQEVANVMKGAGYIASDVGEGLKSAFNASADQVAVALKGAGYGAEAIGGALASAYGASAQAAAQALAAAGFGAQEIGRALQGTFNQTAEQMAQVLHGIGMAPDQIADVAKNVFGATTNEAAQILSSIGVAGDAANSILQGVGYPASEVASVLKSIFSWPPFVNLPFVNLPFINFPHVKLW